MSATLPCDCTVLGVGAALIDLLLEVPDSFVDQLELDRGGMTLVTPTRLDEALSCIGAVPDRVPGGSACNTIAGLAALGTHAVFCGVCGEDTIGDWLETVLRDDGVEPRLARAPGITGSVLSLISPDGQRTMLTSIGASASWESNPPESWNLEGIGLVYLEGYLLFHPDLPERIADRTDRAGVRFLIDCGAPGVVDAFRHRFLALGQRPSCLGWLANEDEARALTGTTGHEALEWMAQHVELAVVKLGARGALIADGSHRHAVAAVPVTRVADTTGAGDAWAAGFLHGLVSGRRTLEAARLGASCAARVIGRMGARMEHEVWRAALA